MLASVLFLWALSLLVPAHSNSLDSCDTNFNHMINDKKVDIAKTCKTVPCLTKCCAEKQILFKNGTQIRCESTTYLEMKYKVTNLEDYSLLAIYNNDITRKIIKTDKKTDDFTILHYEKFHHCDHRQDVKGILSPFVLEDGRLKVSFMLNPNRTVWVNSYEMGEFCFENSLSIGNTATQIAIYRRVPAEDKAKQYRAVISANCMMVSCVFLALVMAVYSLLKELRNLAGIILLAYLATCTAFFLLRAIHVYANHYDKLYHEGCVVMTLLVYYTMLSSFCWMNVMSFDLWWAFRASFKRLPTNRRGVLVKFAWYGLYAWGAPLLASAFVVTADLVDIPGVMKPDVFERGGCFFGDTSHQYYVRFAIGILVCANFLWFVLTAYNIWRGRRAMSQFSKEMLANNKNNETRFLVYVKLSVLMGVFRIFDAIDEEHWIYYAIDALNASVGVFIFILFVCKKKLLLQLCDRFSINNKLVQNLRGHSSASMKTTSTYQSTESECGPERVNRHPPKQELIYPQINADNGECS